MSDSISLDFQPKNKKPRRIAGFSGLICIKMRALRQMQYYANFLIFLCTVKAEWNVRMLFCVVHHEEMRIFKVKKRSEKSRRYVIARIYGFFVFSEICTFVQCGVRRNNIRRIFCRCVLKFTCEKIVRQCDRKTLLYYGFPVDSCYSGKFQLFSVLFWLCPKLEILSFPKKLCDNATAVLPCKIFWK